MNTVGGKGLWDEEDGFYYDQYAGRRADPQIRIRSLVGLIPLLGLWKSWRTRAIDDCRPFADG